jgi:DNA-binding NarL/FixJ family response regulator
MIRVLIFAADARLRRMLEQLPGKEPGIVIAGSADDQESFVRLADTIAVDVVLTDEPRIRHRNTAWVLFLDRASEQAGLEALSAGASAILPLSADLEEVIAAIRMVTNGLLVLPRKLAASVTGRAEVAFGLSGTEDDQPQLSRREIAVLSAMADGLSNKQIARRLGISFHTVKFHIASILEKLEVDTRTEAVVRAAQLGIVML